jgi:hypothetical protein
MFKNITQSGQQDANDLDDDPDWKESQKKQFEEILEEVNKYKLDKDKETTKKKDDDVLTGEVIEEKDTRTAYEKKRDAFYKEKEEESKN